jgi:hypothetical protein
MCEDVWYRLFGTLNSEWSMELMGLILLYMYRQSALASGAIPVNAENFNLEERDQVTAFMLYTYTPSLPRHLPLLFPPSLPRIPH